MRGAAFILALTAVTMAAAQAAAPLFVTVQVADVLREPGEIIVTLCSARSYRRGAACEVAVSVDPLDPRPVTLPVPAPGDYAVKVLHDRNGDRRMNKNFLGWPKEGFGYSRNPMTLTGPATFDAVAVRVERPRDLTVNLRYWRP